MGQLVNPVTLEKGLRADFVKSLAAAEAPEAIMPAILRVPSTSNLEDYGWLGQVPELAEWTDERKLKGVLDFRYQIRNKDYEATIQIDRNTIEDDQLNSVKPRINDLAVRAKQHPRKLFIEALIAGSSELCYDGQAFFSASHSEGMSGTLSNLVSGTGTSLAQIGADLDSAIVRMGSFKDDVGAPFNEDVMDSDLMIVAPMALKPAMEKLFTSEYDAAGATNTYRGRVGKRVYSTRFTDANDWYLLNVGQAMKPVIMQDRQAPRFGSLEGNSDRGFMSKRYVYGVDYRVGFGYGLWQLAIKITNT